MTRRTVPWMIGKSLGVFTLTVGVLSATSCGSNSIDGGGTGTSATGGSGGNAGNGGSAGTGGGGGTAGTTASGGSAGSGGSGGTAGTTASGGTGGFGGNGSTDGSSGSAGAAGEGSGGTGEGGAGGVPEHCDSAVARAWAQGATSEVLALLADDHALWVAGYERANNLDGDGDSVGFVERWPTSGGKEARFSLDHGDADAVTALTSADSDGVWFAGYSDANASSWDILLGRLDQSAQLLGSATNSDVADQVPKALAVHDNRLLLAGVDKVLIEGNAVVRWEDPVAYWFDITLPEQPALAMHQRFTSDDSDGLLGVAFVDGAPWLSGWRTDGAQRGGFVKILDAEGEFMREQVLAPGPVASVAGLISDASQLWVAGTTALPLGEQQFGGQDGFFGLLDSEGAFVWVKQFGTSSSDFITAFTRDSAGNFYVAGETEQATGSGADIIAYRFDAAGNLTGSFKGGTPHDETVTSLAIDHCGVAYVGGGSLGDILGDSAQLLAARHAFVLPIEWE